MTRMRVIGLLGTLAVIIGFALVVYKILRSRGFLWLLRHQLWTVAIVAMLYTILPVDYYVQRYNANQIMAGNPAPSTQIPTHETSAEGLIPLVTLLKCETLRFAMVWQRRWPIGCSRRLLLKIGARISGPIKCSAIAWLSICRNLIPI